VVLALTDAEGVAAVRHHLEATASRWPAQLTARVASCTVVPLLPQKQVCRARCRRCPCCHGDRRVWLNAGSALAAIATCVCGLGADSALAATATGVCRLNAGSALAARQQVGVGEHG